MNYYKLAARQYILVIPTAKRLRKENSETFMASRGCATRPNSQQKENNEERREWTGGEDELKEKVNHNRRISIRRQRNAPKPQLI